jgi:hypothetical protein
MSVAGERGKVAEQGLVTNGRLQTEALDAAVLPIANVLAITKNTNLGE